MSNQIDFSFTPNVLQVVSIASGPYLPSSGYPTFPMSPTIDNSNGTVTGAAEAISGGHVAPNGTGVIWTITFNATANGSSNLNFTRVTLLNPALKEIPVAMINGTTTVGDLTPMPDIEITENSEDWVSVSEQTYMITYTVCNNGSEDAGASNTTITIDGVNVLEDAVPALAAGERCTSTVGPFTMSGTNDTIEVCADNQDEVDESDEENNCLANVFEGIIPKGGIGVAVTPRFNTVNNSVNLSIKIVNTENFDDVFLVSLTNESIPNDWKADLAWFNWTSTEVAIPAGGEILIPLRADVPTNVPAGTKAFRVVVESTLWTPTVFDTGILEIL